MEQGSASADPGPLGVPVKWDSSADWWEGPERVPLGAAVRIVDCSVRHFEPLFTAARGGGVEAPGLARCVPRGGGPRGWVPGSRQPTVTPCASSFTKPVCFFYVPVPPNIYAEKEGKFIVAIAFSPAGGQAAGSEGVVARGARRDRRPQFPGSSVPALQRAEARGQEN